MLALGMPEDWQPPGYVGGSLANGEPRLSLEHRQRLWAAEQHPDPAFRTMERKRVSRLVAKRAAAVCDAHVARVAALAAGQQLLQQLYKMQEQALVVRALKDATLVEERAAASLLTIEREWLALRPTIVSDDSDGPSTSHANTSWTLDAMLDHQRRADRSSDNSSSSSSSLDASQKPCWHASKKQRESDDRRLDESASRRRIRLLADMITRLRDRTFNSDVKLLFAARPNLVLLSAWVQGVALSRSATPCARRAKSIEVWIPLCDFGLGREVEERLAPPPGVDLTSEVKVDAFADALAVDNVSSLAVLPFAITLGGADELVDRIAIRALIDEGLRPIHAIDYRTVGSAMCRHTLNDGTMASFAVERGALIAILNSWSTYIALDAVSAFSTTGTDNVVLAGGQIKRRSLSSLHNGYLKGRADQWEQAGVQQLVAKLSNLGSAGYLTLSQALLDSALLIAQGMDFAYKGMSPHTLS